MKTGWTSWIFSIFLSLHGRAVCRELYPIYEAEDVLQKQAEWTSSDEIEPLKGTSYDKPEAFPASPTFPFNDDNENDITWIEQNIVDRYKFVKHKVKDLWIQQPNFKFDLGTKEFADAAGRVKKFFDRNNDWEATKKNEQFRKKRECTELLYITAARYLFVTYILYEQSGRKLVPCSRSNNKIQIPPSGVCYPEPYGTASCTSDYDVGLVGKDAGILTEKFNLYFQSDQGFKKSSELVFDTNVYAFTLEFAMPFLFEGLPASFATRVAQLENTVNYRMQELASAYYKVLKYDMEYFKTMVEGAKNAMKPKAPESKLKLEGWLNDFSELNKQVALQLWTGLTRENHNKEYQTRVKKMSEKGGYSTDSLGLLAEALLYAAEAYHSRGAIRHVVGNIQMGTKRPLSNSDLWVSIIENWGDTIKEYNHCKEKSLPLAECFLKMSKYMWRTFNAMRLVHDLKVLPEYVLITLVPFEKAIPGLNPESLTQSWLAYKREGKDAIPQRKIIIQKFLEYFRCDNAVKELYRDINRPFARECITKMTDKVNAYNVRLAAEVKDQR